MRGHMCVVGSLLLGPFSTGTHILPFGIKQSQYSAILNLCKESLSITSEQNVDPFSRAGREQLCHVVFPMVLQKTAQSMRLKHLIQYWSPVITLSIWNHCILRFHSHLVKMSLQFEHRYCISTSGTWSFPSFNDRTCCLYSFKKVLIYKLMQMRAQKGDKPAVKSSVLFLRPFFNLSQ